MVAKNISLLDIGKDDLRAKAVHSVSLNRLRAYTAGGFLRTEQTAKLWDEIWEWMDSDVAIGYWLADIDVERIQTYKADPSLRCPYRPADFATRFLFTDPDTAFAFKLRFA